MNELQIITHNNERVLTTSRLAEQYETADIRIKQNFNANKNRYVEGKHYYCLKGELLRAFKNRVGNSDLVGTNANALYLWTEKGALLHAKSLNTDKAWQVYEFLVDNYFNPKQKKQALTDKQAETLEIKKTNARVRLSNQFLKLSKVDTLSEEYKNILVAKAAEVLTGFQLIPLPQSEQKMYTATEIGEMFGVSSQKIGRVSNKYGMKSEEYGKYYRTKSQHSCKEVDSFMYNDRAVERFREIFSY